MDSPTFSLLLTRLLAGKSAGFLLVVVTTPDLSLCLAASCIAPQCFTTLWWIPDSSSCFTAFIGQNHLFSHLADSYMRVCVSHLEPPSCQACSSVDTSCIWDVLYCAKNKSKVSKCSWYSCSHQHLPTCCSCTIRSSSQMDFIMSFSQ